MATTTERDVLQEQRHPVSKFSWFAEQELRTGCSRHVGRRVMELRPQD